MSINLGDGNTAGQATPNPGQSNLVVPQELNFSFPTGTGTHNHGSSSWQHSQAGGTCLSYPHMEAGAVQSPQFRAPYRFCQDTQLGGNSSSSLTALEELLETGDTGNFGASTAPAPYVSGLGVQSGGQNFEVTLQSSPVTSLEARGNFGASTAPAPYVSGLGVQSGGQNFEVTLQSSPVTSLEARGNFGASTAPVPYVSGLGVQSGGQNFEVTLQSSSVASLEAREAVNAEAGSIALKKKGKGKVEWTPDGKTADAVRAKFNRFRNEKSSLEDQVFRLTREKGDYEARIASLSKELSAANEKIAMPEQQNADLQEQISSLKNEVYRLHEEKRDLGARIESLSKELSAANGKIAMLERQNADPQEQNNMGNYHSENQLQSRISTLEGEMAVIKHENELHVMERRFLLEEIWKLKNANSSQNNEG